MKKLFAVLAVSCVALGAFADHGETDSGIDAALALAQLRGLSASQSELSKDEVTPAALQSLLSDDYPGNKIDDDGDLYIKRNGINAYVFVEEGQVLLKFYTRWAASDSISEPRALRVVNGWNNDKVFATASYEDGRFVLRYFVTYEGGINATNFNDSLAWFFSVATEFGKKLEDEDAI